MKQTLENILLR